MYNSYALLASYDRAHWDEMEELPQHLPEVHRKRGEQIVAEGQAITNFLQMCLRCSGYSCQRSSYQHAPRETHLAQVLLFQARRTTGSSEHALR